MVITEIELREIWREGRNELPAFPGGTRFSPAAQDFIKDHRLEIRYAETPAPISATPLPVTNNPLPLTHYQLVFSLAGLVAAEARRYQLPALALRLEALAGYCGELVEAAQHGRAPAPLSGAPAGDGASFAAGPGEHAILHWLGFLRASAELAAAQAAASGQPQTAAALEQVGAAAGGLGRQVLSGELGWNPPMV